MAITKTVEISANTPEQLAQVENLISEIQKLEPTTIARLEKVVQSPAAVAKFNQSWFMLKTILKIND